MPRKMKDVDWKTRNYLISDVIIMLKRKQKTTSMAKSPTVDHGVMGGFGGVLRKYISQANIIYGFFNYQFVIVSFSSMYTCFSETYRYAVCKYIYMNIILWY